MEPRIIRRTVELRRDAQDVERLGILAYTDNKQGHRLELTLTDGGAPADMSGYAARATYLIGAGQAMKLVTEAEIAGGAVRATFPAQAYAAGQTTVVVTAEAEGASIPLYAGCFIVRSGEADALIDPEDIVPDLQTLLAQIDAMETATGAANTAAASANAAAGKAGSASTSATNAASSANAAADKADGAAAAIDGMTASATTLAAGSAATATVRDVDGHKHIALGVPKGDTGAVPAITFTVETGEPGTQVQLSQGGTVAAPTVHLTIPRGDTGAIDGLDYYAGTPAALGEATPGTSDAVARGDHAHPMPTAADVGALAAQGTAADAAMLGGKAPVYYIQPRNLLDNSDFTRPINQRGQTSYTAAGYTIDRWAVTTGLTVSGAGVTSPGGNYLYQWVEQDAIPAGTYTGAIGLADGTVRCGSAIYTGADEAAMMIAMEDLSMYMLHHGSAVQFAISTVTEKTIAWAALYAGAYTADTLPPYVPKGYAAERAECARYAVLPGTGAVSYPAAQITASVVDFIMPVPTRMRATPSIASGEAVVYSAAGAQSGFAFSIIGVGDACVMVRAAKDDHGITSSTNLFLRFSGLLSADL